MKKLIEQMIKFGFVGFLFRDKWKEQLDAGDPYYNPNFSLDYSDFTLRF